MKAVGKALMTVSGRTLVAYFSWGGNTKAVAESIAERLGAELFEIVPADPYPADMDAVHERAQRELTARARPTIAGELPDLDGCDRVILGSPVWLMDAPRIMLSFVEAAGLDGRSVLPFVTFGSTGLSGVDEVYRQALPGVTVADGLAVP
ncbi:MAG: hypothetical protein KIT69_17445, partial [Propionibacteriaceae bacterium]|nr:hypothetical protein [Propionibacteriaceae bacterium]